ncbi:MAG: LacI family transcriptional regulator [Opitutaceae bacterium]|jgi:DNA-binding LacI/PurR family transcriptional regulator|nr:LacI family transcriptional regulator [Opitutaceae bacterium]
MKPPTLHDVAREAGVSHMTVSRVVRGSRAVRPDTAQQVRDVIARLGYRPDPALSALAAYRQRGGGAARGSTLVFIDCDGTAFTRDVWTGAREEAALDGYACEQFPLPPPPAAAQRRLSHVLFHRGVRGLLFGPSEHPQEFAGWDWPEFAAVSLGALAHRPALHAVAMDYFHGAFSGCERLFARGCRRLGLVIDSRLEARTGRTWLGGYAAAVLPRHAPLVCPDEVRTDPPRLRAWQRRHRIDGVLTIHLQTADVLRGSRSNLPVVFLNSSGATLCRFPYYALQPAEIGRHGVRLLHHAVLHREFGLPAEPRRVSLRGTWIEPADDSA